MWTSVSRLTAPMVSIHNGLAEKRVVRRCGEVLERGPFARLLERLLRGGVKTNPSMQESIEGILQETPPSSAAPQKKIIAFSLQFIPFASY